MGKAFKRSGFYFLFFRSSTRLAMTFINHIVAAAAAVIPKTSIQLIDPLGSTWELEVDGGATLVFLTGCIDAATWFTTKGLSRGEKRLALT